MYLVANTRTKFGPVPRMPVPVPEEGLLRRVMVVVSKLIAGEWAGSNANATRHMQVLETLPVGPKKQLLLISCDGERFLVGAGADSVETIVRVRPETTVQGASQDLER